MSREGSREGVRYWFGDFELATKPYRLARRGARVEIAPQPAKLLELLLASAGEVVTREAIRATLWGEGTFVDHVRGINFVVHQIRAALADDASQPQYVETVPRQGYRLIATVSVAGPAKAAVTHAHRLVLRPRRALLLVAVLAMLVVFAIATLAWRLRTQGAQQQTRPRVAVLTASQDGLDSIQPISFIAEELIAHLGEVFGPGLDVVAPPPGVQATKESVMADARYVLSLAAVDGPDSPSLLVRLASCHDHTTLWSASAPMSRRALPDLLGRVVEGVGDSLGISPRSASSLLQSRSPKALEAYLEGKYHLERYEEMRQRTWPHEDLLRSAREELERALSSAPAFERARVALARVALRQRRINAARATAQAVLDKHPSSIQALLVMAEIALYFDRDFDRGLSITAAALALDPERPAALMLRAKLLSATGQHTKALKTAQRSVNADLSNPERFLGLARVAMNAGDYATAIEATGHALAFEPGHCAAWRIRIESLLLAGDQAGALPEINRFLATWVPDPGPATSIRHYWELELHHRHWTEDTVADLLPKALTHIALGDLEQGLGQLLEACEKGAGGDLAFLAVDPRFAPVRGLLEYPRLDACIRAGALRG